MGMAKRRFVPFGKGPVDLLVERFLARKGIDPDGMIGYTLSRDIENVGTITFSMYFEDEPDAEITTIDSPDREFIRPDGSTYQRGN